MHGECRPVYRSLWRIVAKHTGGDLTYQLYSALLGQKKVIFYGGDDIRQVETKGIRS